MTKITIPREALKAAARAIEEADKRAIEEADIGMLPSYEEAARAACLAMLEAWPGMSTGPNIYGRQDAVMHLPLPQEGE